MPATLAVLNLGPQPVNGRELLVLLAVAYEIALRSGISLHAGAADYHSSGAWNALGSAAATARRLQLSSEETLHALGIAEFYGPRSQMMRCIDHPTMLKDGSGWGAMAGVSAALLAQAGFTGAPAATVQTENTERYWHTLGKDWELLRQYFKPHAVCRWAQPAVEAALHLQQTYGFSAQDVCDIRITTFHEATRLMVRTPGSTEEAQYSLPFAVAAAIGHGRLFQDQVAGPALADPNIVSLAKRIEVIESQAYSRQFPARRFADVSIQMIDGTVHSIQGVEPRWDGDFPPTDEEFIEKFRRLTHFFPQARQDRLVETILNVDELSDCTELLGQLAEAPVS